MMKRKQTLYIILLPIVFAVGYFSCVVIHNKIADKHTDSIQVNLTKLFGKDIVKIDDNKCVDIDTLASHEKNLLIFWSPSCKFCRYFFQNKINSEVVGIFCFPLTDDFDYVEFFLKNHEIDYPQLVCSSPEGITSVEAPFVDAIPMFIVVDSQGNILKKQIGIDNVNTLLDSLYKDY